MAAPHPAPAGKTRVAILGGGPAALAAAFELTSTPELEARHEITIYQPGWRPGGKCASGRNPDVSERIEEHGLHVWFGCYDNAFSIVRRCYAELARDPRTQALATWDQAFKPCHDVVVWERAQDWEPHPLRFPPNFGSPGTERPRDFLDVLHEVLAWMERRLRELTADDDEVAGAVAESPVPAHAGVAEACRTLELDVDREEHLGPAYLFESIARLAERHLERATHGLLDAVDDLQRCAALLDEFRDWVGDQLVGALPDHAELRFFHRTVDVVAAAVKGILEDGLLLRGFDCINDRELSEWLHDHGADVDFEDFTRNSAFLRGVYDGSFAFVDGDPARPNMAAGRALQGAIRCLFHYNGAVLWRMQAGMGDAVIAPLYEVLRRRGVRFAFFHAVEEVAASADGGRVESIRVVRQARVHGGAYQPLIEVQHGAKALPCWPDRPLWAQLEDGETLEAAPPDFEHEIDPLGTGRRTTLVAGDDFDVAVLAVPPPVQETICRPLRAASERYDEMLEGAHTVVTQGVQLWLDRTPQELGWRWSTDSLMSMYVEPLDTYCDMSHLLAAESWPPADDVRHCAYLCGVIPHGEVRTPEEAAESLARRTRDFLERDAGRLWPNAVGANGAGFDWRRLVAPNGLEGPDRLQAQYLRVNHQAAERYVLTLAGTVEARLWPAERCFANLVLAGDWTRNGFDAGCVEGAMTSGILAAQEICPALRRKQPAGLDGPSGFPNGPRLLGGPDRSVRGMLDVGVDRVASLVMTSFTRVWSFLPGRWIGSRPAPAQRVEIVERRFLAARGDPAEVAEAAQRLDDRFAR